MTPKVTVYVISHNYGRFLQEAVESVLRQSFGDWELLLIDDGSSDETPEVVRRYQSDERVRTFRTDGVGLPSVCNLALREARGSYLIRLDGDDMFDENMLLVLSHYLDQHPDVAMVFPDFYFIDTQGEITSHQRREKVLDRDTVLDQPANGACSLIRVDVLKDIGGYREDLGAQDGFDLWSNLRGRYRVANVNLPLFYYRRHGQNLTDRTQRILHARRSIKRDAIEASLAAFRPISAIIPCREGYDFQPNLWSAELNGKSLLARDIEKCLRSDLLDHIVVASDTDAVRETLEAYDDPRLRYVERTREETYRSVRLVPTVARMNAALGVGSGGVTVLSYLQAPFVDSSTLEEAVTTLVLNDADCAIGVQEVRDSLYRRGTHGLVPLQPSRGFISDFDTVYREANIAFALRNRNVAGGSLTGPRAVYFPVQSDECFFLHSEQTLQVAEVLDRGL